MQRALSSKTKTQTDSVQTACTQTDKMAHHSLQLDICSDYSKLFDIQLKNLDAMFKNVENMLCTYENTLAFESVFTALFNM